MNQTEPRPTPWLHNPDRLWSAWEMLEWTAARFVRLTHDLFLFSNALHDMVRNVASVSAEPKVRDGNMADAMERIAGECAELGMVGSAHHARTIGLMLRDEVQEIKDVERDFRHLAGSIRAEVEAWHCLLLDRKEASLYQAGCEAVFGQAVVVAYPSAVYDLEESCKSLALGLTEGCVFHLMRALEVAVKASWKSLGEQDPNPNPRGWGDYMKWLEDYVDNKGKHMRPTDWAQRLPYYRDLHADLWTIYKAWRCPVTHEVATQYKQSHAELIFEATKGFYQRLSAHIDESGTYSP